MKTERESRLLLTSQIIQKGKAITDMAREQQILSSKTLQKIMLLVFKDLSQDPKITNYQTIDLPDIISALTTELKLGKITKEDLKIFTRPLLMASSSAVHFIDSENKLQLAEQLVIALVEVNSSKPDLKSLKKLFSKSSTLDSFS